MPKTQSVAIDEASLQVLMDVLNEIVPQNNVYLFGSRVTGNAKQYSDIDIMIAGEPLSLQVLADLNEALSESDLIYLVDVVEQSRISESFYSAIKQDLIKIK